MKKRKLHAAQEMRVGPSKPLCRERLQTATSCCGSMAVVVNVVVKRRGFDCVMYERERRTQVNLRLSIDIPLNGVKTGVFFSSRDQSGRNLSTGQAASGV